MGIARGRVGLNRSSSTRRRSTPSRAQTACPWPRRARRAGCEGGRGARAFAGQSGVGHADLPARTHTRGVPAGKQQSAMPFGCALPVFTADLSTVCPRGRVDSSPACAVDTVKLFQVLLLQQPCSQNNCAMCRGGRTDPIHCICSLASEACSACKARRGPGGCRPLGWRGGLKQVPSRLPGAWEVARAYIIHLSPQRSLQSYH